MLRQSLERARGSIFVRNAAWLFAGQGLSFVLQAVSFIVLARLLEKVQYGVLAGAVALVTVLSQYGSLGAGQLFMRYVTPDHSRFRQFWGNALLSVIVMGGVLVLALRIVGPWLIHRESLSILLLIGVSECVFVQITTCASMIFQTFEKMRVSALLNLLTSLLRCVLAVVMLITMHTVSAGQWAMGSLLVSMVVAAVAIWVVTRSYGLPRFVPRLFTSNAGEGFVFSISGSTTSVYNDIDKVVLSHYGMNAANGIYSMAYRVVNIATMPILSLVGAAFPRFFQVGVNGPAATVAPAVTLLKRTIAFGALAALVMFGAAPILPRLAGPSYQEAILALRWLCLIPLLRCFHLSAGDALSGAGDQKFRLLTQSCAAIGNLVLNLLLIPRYSWLGAAWASLITDGTLGVMNWVALLFLAWRDPKHGRTEPPLTPVPPDDLRATFAEFPDMSGAPLPLPAEPRDAR